MVMSLRDPHAASDEEQRLFEAADRLLDAAEQVVLARLPDTAPASQRHGWPLAVLTLGVLCVLRQLDAIPELDSDVLDTAIERATLRCLPIHRAVERQLVYSRDSRWDERFDELAALGVLREHPFGVEDAPAIAAIRAAL